MEQCSIVGYTADWYDKLREYLRKTFPTYSDEYISFCLEQSKGHIPARIIVNSKGEIVGCNLCSCTKVLIKDEVRILPWSHDTFIDENYRSVIGLELVLHMRTIKHFGLGLTEIKRSIERKLGSLFLEGVNNYYLITASFILSPFQKLFHLVPQLRIDENVRGGKHEFHHINDINEIIIPNNGFWFRGYRGIDFVRDRDFLSQRFVNNKVFSYYLYSTSAGDIPCYFVLRLTKYREMPAITISDYRYAPDHPEMASVIIRVVKHIASRSHIGIVLFVSGDTDMQNALRHRFAVSRPIDFVTNLKLEKDVSFIVTGADSDVDFLK